jgi:spermidine synthase
MATPSSSHGPPAGPVLLTAFVCSGASSLTYQVLWVRELGLVYGNTVASAALVTSLFMLGLGLGGYLAGRWSDQPGRRAPQLLWAYVILELLIAVAGFTVGRLAPHLVEWLSSFSGYVVDARGWHHISASTLTLRAAVGAVLYGPICVAMGASLPVLVRAVAWERPARAGQAVAWLYASNTFGAALGAFSVDRWWIPTVGVERTTWAAVGLGLVAAALVATLAQKADASAPSGTEMPSASASAADRVLPPAAAVRVAMFCSGACALGYEIVWFRVLRYALGGTRGVFSVVLTVVLLGLFVGALAAGRVRRERAAEGLVLALAVGSASAAALAALLDVDALVGVGAGGPVALTAVLAVLPSVAFGATLPLASAVTLNDPARVGRGVGGLYASQTAGNIVGALAAGFVFIPAVGTWLAAVNLALVGLLGAVALVWASRSVSSPTPWRRTAVMAGAGGAVVVLLGTADGDQQLRSWLNAQAMGDATIVVADEGPSDLVMVVERGSARRHLYTNGHPMSGTSTLAHRYMRGMAHVPLLMHPAPTRALVICFGVGNTADAVRQHRSIERLDIADLSREVLELAPYFRATHHDVLEDPRVQVFLNDGRHHLWLQPEQRYDLITLEPPPVTFAGMASLYGRDFYALARSRLTDGGYLSQWLPAYQTTPEVTLAMVRAFVDVFEEGLLLLGYQQELILLGRNADGPLQIDPEQLASAIAADPALERALERIFLDDVHEMVGMVVGGPAQLATATAGVLAVSDDRPSNEYQALDARPQLPATLFDAGAARRHCPRCPPPGTEDGDRLDRFVALTSALVSHPSFLLAPGAPALGLGVTPPPGSEEALSQEPFLLTQFASIKALRMRADRVQATAPVEAVALLTKASALARQQGDAELQQALDGQAAALKARLLAPP